MKVAKVSAGSLPPGPIPAEQIESKISQAFHLKQDKGLFDAVFKELRKHQFDPIADCRKELSQFIDQNGKSLLIRALELDPSDYALIEALVAEKIALERPDPYGGMPLDLAARMGDLRAIEILYPNQPNKVKESARNIAEAAHQINAVIKLLTLPRLNDQTPIWSSLITIGKRYYSEGFFEGALALYTEALAVADVAFTDEKDEGNFLITWHHLAKCFAARGDFSKALVYYEKAYEKIKNTRNPYVNFVPLIHDLAKCHTNLGDHKKARAFLRMAQKFEERCFMGPHSRKVAILNKIALSYAREKNMNEANEYVKIAYEQALELKEEGLCLSAVVLDNQGQCYFINEQYQEAIVLHEKALRTLRVFAQDESFLIIVCLEHLAQCHLKLGNCAKAKEIMEEASQLVSSLPATQ